MSPLGLNDDEMNAISALAAANLAGYPAGARGPGLVHRVAAEAQREFLKAGPIAVGFSGKYGR